ncbi:cold shock domain-containing protein [Bacterioplanoides pacificum]|uniref:Cold shock domain-containing protein n=1 Tax=Bacterioplanoides pacificum TaxID=1171596 RepID=A0ABV7VQW6_9GAMM
MGKVLIRKIIVALVSAAVLPGLMLVIFPDVFKAQTGLLLALAIAGFVISLVSAQLVPARRRRYRGSGTVVENDVEDGRERGVVKWFNVKKGFGFITWDEGEDVFVHFRSIRGQGHRSLTEGQRVKFAVVRGQKGPQAEDVSAIR